MQYLITDVTLHTGEAILPNASLLLQNGRVQAINPSDVQNAKQLSLKGKHLAPSFIDIQLNGGEQLYFSDNPSQEALQDMYEASTRHGAAFFLPCLISAPLPKILKAIEEVRTFMATHPGVLGMHLEGPFLNPAKKGAHSAAIIRKPTNDELLEIIHYGKDVIKLMTIAPEMFTPGQIALLQQSGIILSAGHSNMNFEQADVCFKNGIHLVTHMYNAMTQMGHREPGIVGAVFENEQVYAPIILDGAHCHYAAAKIAYRIKKDKLLLLTDAAFLGRKRHSFQNDLLDAQLVDGFYRNKDGNLAGAAISMIEAVCNAVKHAGIPLDEAVKMATIRVATALGMQQLVGKIAPGYPACFVSFEHDLTNFEMHQL